MLKCRIKKGSWIRTRIKGTAGDLATETAMLVGIAYQGIKKENPDAAEAYKHKLQILMLDPQSPVWKEDPQ